MSRAMDGKGGGSTALVTAAALAAGFLVSNVLQGRRERRRVRPSFIFPPGIKEPVSPSVGATLQAEHAHKAAVPPRLREAGSEDAGWLLPGEASTLHSLPYRVKEVPPELDRKIAPRKFEGEAEAMAVGVRCRPLFDFEIAKGMGILVDSRGGMVTDLEGGNAAAVDAVFEPEADQEDVYDDMVAHLVESVLAGYNSTIFTYGQSGTGKTHTVMGKDELVHRGMLPRALQHIFESVGVSGQAEEHDVHINMSVLGMYNSTVKDLLQNDEAAESAPVVAFNPFIDAYEMVGQTVVGVASYQEAMELLRLSERRQQEVAGAGELPTGHAHTLYVVTVEWGGVSGVLSMADLAGSEAKPNEELGKRGRHGKGVVCMSVDHDLSALAREFIELAVRHKRNMKQMEKNLSALTRSMSPALGGHARAAMIATISPARDDAEETFRTLRYAEVARGVVNRVARNMRAGEEQRWLAEKRLVSAWGLGSRRSFRSLSGGHKQITAVNAKGAEETFTKEAEYTPDHRDFVFQRLEELFCDRKYRVHELFKQMSPDGRGALPLDELLRFVRLIVPEVTPQQARRFRALMDADCANGNSSVTFYALSGACRRCKAVGARGSDSPVRGIQILVDAFGPEATDLKGNLMAWDLYGDGKLDHGQLLRLLRRDLPAAGPCELRLIMGELDELLQTDDAGKLSIEGIFMACYTLAVTS